MSFDRPLKLPDRRTVLLSVLCSGLGWPALAASAAGGGPSAASALIRLPDRPKDVIVRWDRAGGMRPGSPVLEPALVIHADGTFFASPLNPGGARRAGRLTPAQLQAVLHDIVDRQDFGSIRAEQIQAQLREVTERTGRLLNVMDGGITRIEVRLPDGHHAVEMPALHAAHHLFPEVEPLQRLFAIQQRLLDVTQAAR